MRRCASIVGRMTHDGQHGDAGARRRAQLRGVSRRSLREPRGPAILVLSDMFGLNEPIRAVADIRQPAGHARWCRTCSGARTFPASISYDDPQHAAAWARLKALDLDVVSADMATAVDWLRAQPFAATARSRRSASAAAGGLPISPRCGAGSMARPSLYGLGISEHLGEIATRAVSAATALRPEGPAHPAPGDRCGFGRRARSAQGRGVPLSGGRALVRQSGAADLRRRCGDARERADRGDAEVYLSSVLRSRNRSM